MTEMGFVFFFQYTPETEAIAFITCQISWLSVRLLQWQALLLNSNMAPFLIMRASLQREPYWSVPFEAINVVDHIMHCFCLLSGYCAFTCEHPLLLSQQTPGWAKHILASWCRQEAIHVSYLPWQPDPLTHLRVLTGCTMYPRLYIMYIRGY